MKLKGDDEKLLYVAERLHPAQVFQSKFKGGKIAVKIARLYVPQRADELLRVSIDPPRTRVCEW